MKKLFFYIQGVLLFLIHYSIYADPIPIAIYSPNFGPEYISNWQLNGDNNITTIIDGNVLQLTPSSEQHAGTTFWISKICNTGKFEFSAFFSFKCAPTVTSYADGITFMIQQNSNTYGGKGGGIGYLGMPGKSIAIEYDTWLNKEVGFADDPDNNHIAIDINGSVNHTDNTAFFNNAKVVASGSDLASLGINMADSEMKYTWIDYDGEYLEVRISNSIARPDSPILRLQYDLTSYFDGTAVFYGFGAATGDCYEQHLIYSAYIDNRYNPIDLSKHTYTQSYENRYDEKGTICPGESYWFNGAEYTEPGTYPPVVLTNISGCDSIITLILDLAQPSSAEISKTICLGDSYDFYGTNYSTAGIYTAKLTNAAGCDSTVTLNLDVAQPSSSEVSATICEGESYPFNGKVYSTPGTYTAKLKNVAGCDSIVTLNLNIIQPTNSINYATIWEGESYYFNGTDYYTTGTYIANLQTKVGGCDSTATLILTVLKPNNTEISKTICQGETYNFYGTNYSTTGTYTKTLGNPTTGYITVTLYLYVAQPSSSEISATICEGENYYFDGTDYKNKGTYTAKLKNVAGCDSIVTLYLTVIQPTNSINYATIWEGESYYFNGTDYSAAGTYTAYLQTKVGGCDSTATLVLTVLKPNSTEISKTICQGETYNFYGTNYSTTGTYTKTLGNPTDGYTTVTLYLHVAQPTSSLIYETICEGETYSFNGTNYKNTGTYTAKLKNVAGCDSIVTLNLHIIQPTNSINYATIWEGESYHFNGTDYSDAGTYTAYLQTKVGGCDSTATLILTVLKPNNTEISKTICQGETYNFYGTDYSTAGIYTKTLGNPTDGYTTVILYLHVAMPTSSKTHKTICQGESYPFNGKVYSTAGTYTVKLANAAGCDSTVTLTLDVLQPTSAEIYETICQGESYPFNGELYSTAGTYIARLTNAAGCDSTVTLTLDVLQPTSAEIYETICRGESYPFNGKLYSVAGAYIARLTNAAGCDSTVTLNLDVAQPYRVEIYKTICQGETYLFNGTDYSVAGTYTANLTSKADCDSIVTLNLNVALPTSAEIHEAICQGETYLFNGTDYSVAGTYTANLTSNAGCDSIVTFTLDIKKVDNTEISATIHTGESYLFNGAYYSAAGTYIVNLTNTAGCDSIVTLILKMIKEVEISPYFTPNGDGYHDRWEIKNIGDYPDADIYIYDRFGRLMVHYKGTQLGWDGKSNGKDMPPDDYWFTINLHNGDKIRIGHFTLIR